MREDFYDFLCELPYSSRYFVFFCFFSMPPVPSNATDEQFRRASYMVEVYWLAVVYNRMPGTMIYMSSDASNRTKDRRYFEVFFIPSVAPASILGRCSQGIPLGYVKDYCEAGIIQTLSILPISYPGHSLLTEDEGILLGEDDCECGRLGKYFKILGRLKNSELRGCSDTYAEHF